MPRVQVGVNIAKTRQNLQQQLQQIAKGIQVQVPVKTNLTSASSTVFDTAKLEADGRRYFQSTSNIIDNVKREFASLGTVDVTNVFKSSDGNIQSFTANVKKAGGEVESYRFKLAQLTDGVTKFSGFVQMSSTLTDKTAGTGLQKTLNYLNGIETQINNITSAATVTSSKPLLPGTAEYDAYQIKLQEVNTRIQQIRSSTNVLSDDHKREINSMVADLKLYAQQLQSTAYSTSELDALINADTLGTNISTAQARIQNLKTTYSSFVSDPKLMQEWESLFNQSQIISTQDELNNLNAQVKSFEQKLISAGKKGASAFSQLVQQFKGIASWMIIGTVISSVMSGVRGTFTAITELDTQMVELKKVTDETAVAYDRFLDRAYDKAIRLGTSVTDLVEATANFARLGYEMSDAEALAEVATIYQAVGDEIDSVDDATQNIISTMNAFGVSSNDAISIVDKLNEVANNFAITSGGLVKGAIDTGTGLLGWLTAVIDKLGTLPVLLSTIGGARSLTGNKGLFRVNSAGTGITTSFSLSKQAAAEFTKQLNTDIDCLQKFETAVQNGTYATGDFDKMMAGASAQAKTYAATTKGAAGSTLQYKVAQDAAASSTKKMGVSAKVASIGVQVLNVALNAFLFMGIGLAINGLVAGFDALVNATAKASEKANEFALEQQEIAKAASEEAKSIDELIEKYKQLRAEEYVDADSRAEVRDIQSQITSLVGDQATNLDLVNGKLDDEIKKLKQIQLESARGAQDSYVASYHADRSAADQAVGEDKFLFINGYGYVGPNDKAAFDILKGLKNSMGTPLFQKGGFFGTNLFSLETGSAEERIEQLTLAMEALKSAADYDYTDSDLYAGLSAAVKLYETYVTKLNESTSGLVKSTVTIAALESDIYGKTINSAEAYDQYRQSIINAALADEALSAGLSDNAITVDAVTAAVDDLMATNFPDWYNQTRESVSTAPGASKITAQYETLADALGAVKQAQDAYKNVKDDIGESSDGSISLATLSSLVNTYSDLSGAVSDYLAGTVNAETILDALAEKFNRAADAAGYQKSIMEDLTEETSAFSDIVNDMASYDDAYNSLSEALTEFIDYKRLSAETLSGLLETFGETEGLKSLMAVLGQEGATVEQVEAALEQLGAEYLDVNDILGKLTEETAGWAVEALEAKGVVNAQAIVMGRLAAAELDAEYGAELLALSTWNEIEAFLKTEGVAENVIDAYSTLRAAKVLATKQSIDFTTATENEIKQLRLQILAIKDNSEIMQKFNVINASRKLMEWYAEQGNSDMVDRYAASIGRLQSELDDMITEATKVDIGSGGINLELDDDTFDDAFEKEYARRKHLVETEQQTLKEFYDWLDGEDGYKRYYTKNGEYAGEYYKYNEEVFSGLRKLYEDDLDAREKALKSLSDYEGSVTIKDDVAIVDTNTKAIVEGYKHLIGDVEAELKKVENNPAAAEYAQSLRDRIQGYRDAIKETLADIDDFKEDWEADEHLIFLWEQAGGHETDIVKQYREMQDEAHAVAEEFRKIMRDSGMEEWEIEQSEVIKNLSSQWWGYEEEIRSIFDAVSETINDHVNDFEHQIKLLEHVGGEDGANNAQIIGLYNHEIKYLLDQIESYKARMEAAGYTAEQIANSGVVQELQGAIMSCENSLRDIIDDMNGDLYDSMESLLDLTMDMIKHEKELEKEGLEKQVDSYKEVVELKKEMLQLSERNRAYQEEMDEKTAEINKVQARIDALAMDDSRAAAIERGKLEEELAELKDGLADKQREHYLNSVEEQLDTELDEFAKTRDAQIKEIDNFLDDQNALTQAAYSLLENMNIGLFNRLTGYATTYTATTRTELINMWGDAKAAAEEYGSYVSAMNATENGTFYSSGTAGSVLTNSSEALVESQVNAIIQKMQANSLKWHTVSREEQKAMLADNPNRKLADIIEGLTGRELYLGNDGVWYYDKVGGEVLYKFHTGGVVGGDSMPTPKQDELFALLQKKEIVLNETQQGNLWSMLGRLNPINSLKNVLSSFSGLRQGRTTSSPIVQVDASVNIDGTMPDKQIIQILKNHPRDVANIVSRELDKF